MKKNSLIISIIHIVILLLGITIAFVIPEKITANNVISVIFTSIAYIVFALIMILGTMDSRENVIQNSGITIVAVIYLVVCFVLSMIFNLVHMSIKWHIVLEVIIAAVGIIMVAVMYLAKIHIEEQN